MFNESHDLVKELPEFKDKIHALKASNRHFSKLYDEYHTVDRETHRIAQEIETPSDEYVEAAKKRRLALKDELVQMLRKA